MKYYGYLLFLLCALSAQAQIKMDSLIIVTSNTLENEVRVDFVLENLTNEFIYFYWYLEIGENNPLGRSYIVIDRTISYNAVSEDFHTPCEPDGAYVNHLEPNEIWDFYRVSVFPDGVPGTDSLRFCLTEVCGDLESALICTDIIVSIEDKTSLLDLDEPENEFSVYPNPTKGTFKLDATDEVYSLEIYDSRGLLLKSENHNPNKQYELSNVPEGIYFILLKDRAGNLIGHNKLYKN